MNTAEGSARLLRQHGPKGTMLLQTFAYPSFFQSPSLWLSIHLLVLRAGTQLRPLETGGLIFLSLWQQKCHPEFSFCAISTSQQHVCPASPVSSSVHGTFASVHWLQKAQLNDMWGHKHREVLRSRPICVYLQLSGFIDIMQTVEEPVLTPDSTAGDVNL